jgi:hypothetical protein
MYTTPMEGTYLLRDWGGLLSGWDKKSGEYKFLDVLEVDIVTAHQYIQDWSMPQPDVQSITHLV